MISLFLEKTIIGVEVYPPNNQSKSFQPTIRLTIYPYSRPAN